MKLPTQHSPNLPLPSYWDTVSPVLVIATVACVVVTLCLLIGFAAYFDRHLGVGAGRYGNQMEARYDSTPAQKRARRIHTWGTTAGAVFGIASGVLIGTVIVQTSGADDAYDAAQKRHDAAERAAVRDYQSDLVGWFKTRYGVTVSERSALNLIHGKEVAGVTESGTTVTLSLLNLDDPVPVLVGTDHNPLPVLKD